MSQRPGFIYKIMVALPASFQPIEHFKCEMRGGIQIMGLVLAKRLNKVAHLGSLVLLDPTSRLLPAACRRAGMTLAVIKSLVFDMRVVA